MSKTLETSSSLTTIIDDVKNTGTGSSVQSLRKSSTLPRSASASSRRVDDVIDIEETIRRMDNIIQKQIRRLEKYDEQKNASESEKQIQSSSASDLSSFKVGTITIILF